MMRILAGLLLALCLLSGSGFAQTQPCTVTDHAEYTKKIKEFTTESFFSTELVDHLPLSSCVPPPDAFLHHIIGAIFLTTPKTSTAISGWSPAKALASKSGA